MTAREVLSRLTYDECREIAAICLERTNPEHAADLLFAQYTHEELAEIGLKIRAYLTSGGA